MRSIVWKLTLLEQEIKRTPYEEEETNIKRTVGKDSLLRKKLGGHFSDIKEEDISNSEAFATQVKQSFSANATKKHVLWPAIFKYLNGLGGYVLVSN